MQRPTNPTLCFAAAKTLNLTLSFNSRHRMWSKKHRGLFPRRWLFPVQHSVRGKQFSAVALRELEWRRGSRRHQYIQNYRSMNTRYNVFPHSMSFEWMQNQWTYSLGLQELYCAIFDQPIFGKNFYTTGGSSVHHARANGPAKSGLSSKSSSPPKPGIRIAESFFSTSRLISDSQRSPTSPTSPITAE